MKPVLFLLSLAIALAALRAEEPPRKVVCFGDSITAGSNMKPADRPQLWVDRVQAASQGRLEMINEGKGGRPTDSLGEFAQMLTRRPKADELVLALGGNDARNIKEDCVPKAVKNLTAMVARARAAYGAEIAILIVGPTNINQEKLGPTKPIGKERDGKLQELNAAFAKLAQELHCSFVSLYGVVPPETLTQDGVHPDAAGNEPIARLMLSKLLPSPDKP
jgi:acyl-CoA thioesterase I